MRLIATLLAGASLLAVAACGDNKTDDVVQTPASGGAAQPVSEHKADQVTAEAALALGMTRKELEDADLVTPTGADLGDVDSLVLDAAGKVTHLVVEINNTDDVKVLLPLDRVSAHTQPDGGKDLKTSMTTTELLSLPKYVPAA